MVARTTTIGEPYPLPPDWIATRSRAQFWLTRRDVDAMLQAGIIPEDTTTELLHGALMRTDRARQGEDPLSVGDDHTKCVELLSDLRSRINNADRDVRSQQPLICSDTHEPQPDFVILRGSLRDYVAKPTARDAFCVIEVADSSYERDAGEKLFGYAQAGIEQYIIINLRNRTAEVYTKPNRAAGTYPPPQIVKSDEVLSLRSGGGDQLDITVSDLLP